mmetsp:Transcript_37087/g.86511  ORF Transcript_37087/g.86511 Transcript_37087/m.86511 type:complete len:163 (-) Transcript_37087:2541-3029(-)
MQPYDTSHHYRAYISLATRCNQVIKETNLGKANKMVANVDDARNKLSPESHHLSKSSEFSTAVIQSSGNGLSTAHTNICPSMAESGDPQPPLLDVAISTHPTTGWKCLDLSLPHNKKYCNDTFALEDSFADFEKKCESVENESSYAIEQAYLAHGRSVRYDP